ncbi:hypothetical protein LTR05_005295 [Lithohypha guttulata]|uniref:Exonuclease domain-containing protein n=1 Tax=Lithohypha guttulata TaxID=1690604 RepID=A0AAN7Y5U0_9EURO|nr:hypothetical protein LTR05_005295 [Lithohypha guttulata]
MATKRKRYHHHRGTPQDEPSSDHKKRRRLSDDAIGYDENSRKTHHHSRGKRDEMDEDGWTKVSSKSSKRDKSNKQHERDLEDYPRLRMHQNYQGEIKLKDLRDLALYLLADEAAPKWLAVANSRRVKKVVVVMLPGMDEALLRQIEKLAHISKDLGTTNGTHGQTEVNPSTKTEDVEQLKTDVAQNDESQDEPRDKAASYSWLFDNILQVRGPGDAKTSKVHSPLQAMLLSQGSDKSQQNNNRGHAAERTALADFIHLADELREAEFPIHPAAFTSKLDAELEANRRERTGQSTKAGWVDSNVSVSQVQLDATASDQTSQGLNIYSVDCEMVQTCDDATSLARVSIVSYPDGKTIIDKYVKPAQPITNYFTQFSGITPEILENVTTTLQDVQKEILELLTPASVLLGHSLDSDLNALKLTHPFLVDTSIIYPHPRGLPLRSSLKYLANKYLKREIQTGGANGHNSVEDAQAVLDLVKLKCEKGPKWGTIEANGEPVFRRLKRNGRTSAMVEYGTPERGYGKDATYTIGCQNDDEVVQGVVRAVKGDNFYDFEIPAGGVDFVWGRLRALEFVRGWVSGASVLPRDVKKDDTGLPTESGNLAQEEKHQLDALAVQTLERLQRIHEALPAKSLLMVCSGTSDVRPVIQLQAQQQQYRKEFKVKKWDELTIKWTDTEEQALRRACEAARAGWGVCTIK